MLKSDASWLSLSLSSSDQEPCVGAYNVLHLPSTSTVLPLAIGVNAMLDSCSVFMPLRRLVGVDDKKAEKKENGLAVTSRGRSLSLPALQDGEDPADDSEVELLMGTLTVISSAQGDRVALGVVVRVVVEVVVMDVASDSSKAEAIRLLSGLSMVRGAVER